MTNKLGTILVDVTHPLRPDFHHTHTHRVMLTHNPYINITMVINNNGKHALHIFIVTTVRRVHWPIKVTRRENSIFCPVWHWQWRLKNSYTQGSSKYTRMFFIILYLSNLWNVWGFVGKNAVHTCENEVENDDWCYWQSTSWNWWWVLLINQKQQVMVSAANKLQADSDW